MIRSMLFLPGNTPNMLINGDALGADAVLVGRPLCIAAIGGGVEGVTKYWQQMQGQLVQAMLLTGCASLADVREHIIYRG